MAKCETFMERIANKVLRPRALLRGKIFQNGCQHFACEWLLMSGLRASSNCDVHWPLGRGRDFLLKIKLRTWGGPDKWSEFRQWCFCRKIPGIRFDKCPCLVLAEILFKIYFEMLSLWWLDQKIWIALITLSWVNLLIRCGFNHSWFRH